MVSHQTHKLTKQVALSLCSPRVSPNMKSEPGKDLALQPLYPAKFTVDEKPKTVNYSLKKAACKLLLSLLAFNLYVYKAEAKVDNAGKTENEQAKNEGQIEAPRVQNRFAVETGYNGTLLSGYLGHSFNLKALYLSKTSKDRWDYFLDYAMGFQEVSLPTIEGERFNQFGHFLVLGTRYYFDNNWVIDPYASIALGVYGTHIETNWRTLQALPVVVGAVGVDYMITPTIGLNAELTAPIVALQLKLNLRIII